MTKIKTLGTKQINTNDLNTVLSCPHCGAGNNRIIHGGKKWKCLECFKSFKTPKIVKTVASNIQNITVPPKIDDIILNELSNSPSIDMLSVDKEGNNPLITSSKEIENFIKTEKNEITSQIQRENEPSKSSEISIKSILIKSDLPSIIELSDKLETTELLKTETTEVPKIEVTEPPKSAKKRIIIRKRR